jgi:transformation/transcription domain-associated protein
MFDAVHIPDIQEQAQSFLQSISRTIFETEFNRSHSGVNDIGTSTGPSLSCFLDALPYAICRDRVELAKKARELVLSIILDLVAFAGQRSVPVARLTFIFQQIANRFCGMCSDDSWMRKIAGCQGIKLMLSAPELGTQWVRDREVDLVRTLLHLLKDLPADLSQDIEDAIDVLKMILHIANPKESEERKGENIVVLSNIFFMELPSSNAIVRRTAQECIDILATLSDTTVHDLLLPQRNRMFATIYNKPLRALPFAIQIGMVEAVRYCMKLGPGFVSVNDELLRLLHEALALADAEDSALLGRNTARTATLEIVKLRVACIRLLTAAMPLTDFFHSQSQTRQRYVYSTCVLHLL